LCRTCECHVLEGRASLSQPSEKERALISNRRRADGYRLACQAELIDTRGVRVVSRAEELRRLAARILVPERPGQAASDAFRLTGSILQITAAAVEGLPYVASHIVPQIAASPPTVTGVRDYVADAISVMQRALRGLPPK
jgi:hypothetical protein